MSWHGTLFFERASAGLCGGRLTSVRVTYPGTAVVNSLCTDAKKIAGVYAKMS